MPRQEKKIKDKEYLTLLDQEKNLTIELQHEENTVRFMSLQKEISKIRHKINSFKSKTEIFANEVVIKEI